VVILGKTNPACRVHDKPGLVKTETLECVNTSSLAGGQEMMMVMHRSEIRFHIGGKGRRMIFIAPKSFWS
jgi:hypothetical protein